MSKFVFHQRKSFSSEMGFSLIELLIYIGIIGVVSGMLVGILSTVTKTQIQESAQNDVTDQLNFVMSTVQRLVRDSSLIQLDSGVASSTLTLRMSALANDPTIVYLSNGQVYVQQGTGAAQSITSDKVNVDSLQFRKLSQPPGRDIVQVDLSMSEVQPAAGQTISRALRSAFARVNAATFDYDLIPGTDNKWSVGANPSTRWLNGAFSGNVTIGGNVGIGTTAPLALLQAYSSILPSMRDGFTNLRLDYNGGYEANSPGAQITFAQRYVVSDPSIVRVGAVRGWKNQPAGSFGGGVQLLYQPPAATDMLTGMTLDMNGNVGIGTTTPTELLTLNLSDSSTSTAETILGINRLTTGTAAAGIGTSLNFRAQASDGTLVDIGQIKSVFTNASSTTPQSSIQLTSGNSLGIFINETGKVGIGTAVPSTKLDVSGEIRVGNNLPYHYSYTSTVGGWQTPQCSCDVNSATQDCQKEFDSTTDQGSVCYDQWAITYPVASNRSDKYTRSGGTDLALQTSSGNVGIGSSTSTSKLTVNGNASIGSSYIGDGAPSNGLIIQGNVGVGMITAPAPLSVTGHIGSFGSSPTVSGCGTGSSILGTDTAGIVTPGTSGSPLTSCTLTFATAYADAPACVITNYASNYAIRAATTATTLIVYGSASPYVQKFGYVCYEITSR